MIEIKGQVVPERVTEDTDIFSRVYNPDVLLCLANLSNDEVFTPPEIANQMLDMLPQELFRDPNTKFLDPACKSGVFLREIAKRLITGLEDTIPDLEERVNHICQEQLYGIAITELTSLLSRRSLYCSKYPNGPFSIARFKTVEGNIRFKACGHEWEGPVKWKVEGRKQERIWRTCKWCGASEKEFGEEKRTNLESHAYELIHTLKPEEIFSMKFDVIISNPPYQLNDGGNNASAMPIYQKFMNSAKKLKPRYISMIIPSRWYCGGRGLEDFRNSMLTEGHLCELHDYKKSSDCFPGIRNGGGICYFLWDSNYNSNIVDYKEHDNTGVIREMVRPLDEFGDIFIRDSVACGIIRKVISKKESSLSDVVYRQKPFGFRTNFVDFDKNGDIKIYTKKVKCGYDFIKRNRVTVNTDIIDKWKLVTSRSTSVPEEDNGQVLRLSQTFIVEPGAVVTESYVVVDVFDTEEMAENCYSYLKTKFFRFLCQPTIVSPDVSKRTFVFVPLLDFDKSWTDAELYKKYGLSDFEVEYVETLIKEAGGDN